MTYRIEPRMVAAVVTEANQMLVGRGFNPVEAMIGLSELVGRIIVEVGTTSIQMDELREVVAKHIERTVRIGAQVTEKSNQQA